ncbi:cyclic nucleotide-binding domain-containing protein [Rhizobium sp. P38BS-XIX]|uniref:cyclic nucleotide-binding domain-containing protein n=1 Tax=Rhizobium sp. P38BS-XIX TaxID=2726740 RepID=UPI0014566368|nr:cyclic nucleotide-binding domain-containing protein [Rhizobium sp. P38BS-XIX]NLR99229.1 cyclic nucleotide-binding domain-containing protein [Rhizobium sp. P38BS-XIX]
MALNDDIRLLSQLPLFHGMGDEPLRLIAFGADRRHVTEGQTLFREKSPAECAYVVTRGSFELSTADAAGQKQVQAVVQAGTMLSELALVTLVERKYTAVAAEESDVIRITRALFHRLIEEYPDAGLLIQNRIRDNFAALARQAAALLGRFS